MKRRVTQIEPVTTKTDELSAAGMKRVLKDAKARVVKENLQRGIAITVIEHGQLVQIQPDKTRRVLNKAAGALVSITKTRFRIG